MVQRSLFALWLIPIFFLVSRSVAASENPVARITLSWEFCSSGGWIQAFVCRILCNVFWFAIQCDDSPSPLPPAPTPSQYNYYSTCGDPVCSQWREKGEIALCPAGVRIGDSCDTPNYTCDPKNDCNSLVKCTDSDPTTQPGGCPISTRQSKRDVAYLTQNQQQNLAQNLLAFKLATWNYKNDPLGTDPRLGFIIEDVLGKDPGAASLFQSSPAVDENRGMVDLYGFLSMAVATLQTQQREMDSLRCELESLKAAMPQQCEKAMFV
jgi:hypothetical protein